MKFIVAVIVAAFAIFQVGPGGSQLNSGWNPLLIGGGGYVRGLDIQCDQGVGQCSNSGTTTKVVRTDTYGAYLWITSGSCFTSVAAPCWQQLLTTNAMPAGELLNTNAAGVYEIAIAPSNTSIFYMVFNGKIYKTINKGVSWTTTGFSQISGIGANGGQAGYGRFMGVSPANSSVVYVGTPANGVWYTTNGGTSWTQISTATIPVGSSGGGDGNLIYFDTSDATGNTLYASSYGHGIYKCTSALTTPSCSQTTATGMPTQARHMVVDSGGVLWLTSGGNVYRYKTAAWAQLLTGTGNGYWSVAVDPANAAHVIVADEGGQLNITVNGTTTTPTWTGTQTYTNNNNRTATDIPWLAVTNEQSMTNGDQQFDPAQSNQLIFSEGIGVWTAPGPTTAVLPAWVSMTKGIEQLVAVQVIVPPGSNAPVVTAWDRPVFYQPSPNTYPSTVNPSYNNPPNAGSQSIVGGWAIDYASSSPNFVVGLFNSNLVVADLSGYSTNYGQTYTQLPTTPMSFNGGSIGASNTTDWILCYNENGNCYWTVNAGTSWTQITSTQIPNLPNSGSGTTGWGFADYTNRQIVAADRVTNDVFYLYNYLTSPAIAGIYICTINHSAPSISCVQGETGSLGNTDNGNTKLVSMPGVAGELFFTADFTSTAAMQKCTTSGSTITCSAVTSGGNNFTGVNAIGFGKVFSTYASIVIYGTLNGVTGLYISKDNAATWTLISSAVPLGNATAIGSIACDYLTPMNCYFAMGSGSGWTYYGGIN